MTTYFQLFQQREAKVTNRLQAREMIALYISSEEIFSINVSVIKSKGDSYFILSMKMKMVSPRSTLPGLR